MLPTHREALRNWGHGAAVFVVGGLAVHGAKAIISEPGGIVSLDDGPNTLLSCAVGARSGAGTAASPHQFTSRLRKYNSKGISQDWTVVNPSVSQRARINCFTSSALTGGTVVEGPDSTDSDGDNSTATCPSDKPFGAYQACRMNYANANVTTYVYRTTPCGDGITSITSNPDPIQLTGSASAVYYNAAGVATMWKWNDTHAQGSVDMTDLGIPFFSAGRMYYAFGDTKPSAPGTTYDRHSTIAAKAAGNYDPYSQAFSSWENVTPGSTPPFARQLIPNDSALAGESPIPTAAWAISEVDSGGVSHEYRYMHFMSVQDWRGPADPGSSSALADGFAMNIYRSSIARSIDGGAWARFDSGVPATPCSATAGLWWCPSSNFTSVAAWHDNTPQSTASPDSYIYFAGIKVHRNMGYSDSNVKLMRVKATKATIENKNQYQYWIGTSSPPSGCTTAPWCSGDESIAATLKDSAGNNLDHVRELSLSYNSYANRFVLMYLRAGQPYFEQTWLAMYQATALTGPWTSVASGGPWGTSSNPLPWVLTMYGPFMHDRNNAYQGQHMIFSLSENYLPNEPYNVATWIAYVTRGVKQGCQ